MATIQTITDNGDGTVSVTVSSNSGGAQLRTADTASLFTRPTAWTDRGGVFSGPGPVSFGIPSGMHWLSAVDTGSGAYSEPQPFWSTNGQSAEMWQCLEAVKATIQTLNLPDIGSNVVIRKVPAQQPNDARPMVLLFPAPERIDPSAGTNARDDVGYGVVVSIMFASNHDVSDTMMPQELLARRRVIAAFHNQRLSGGPPAIVRCAVEAGQIFAFEAWQMQLDAGALVIRCISREARGLI